MMAVVSEVTKNPISQLQEVCQVWKVPLPSYSECAGSYQEFGTEVRVAFPQHESLPAEQVELKALGRTKKSSKTKAAQDMLDHITSHRPYLMQRPPVGVAEDEDMPVVWRRSRSNQQQFASADPDMLAHETHELAHVPVTLELCLLIQQTRLNSRLSQKDLAAKINEKVGVVNDYESGKAVPNHQVIAKLERALGVHLRGEKAGQPKIIGRGRPSHK